MLNIPDNVKALFSSDNAKKQFRVSFPNSDREDITNEQIESESLTFTESICSQNPMKFGLCEASQITFVCYGIDDIKDEAINAYIEIKTGSEEWYSVFLGLFYVTSCKRDAQNLNKRQIEANSYISAQNWAIPKSITALKRYTWRAKQTLNFSGIDFIDLVNPSNHFNRNASSKISVNNKVVLDNLVKQEGGLTASVVIEGYKKNLYSFSGYSKGICSIRANYSKSDFKNILYNIRRELKNNNFPNSFINNFKYDTRVSANVGHKKYNSYGEWDKETSNNVIAGLDSQASNISIVPNGNIFSFIILDGVWENNTRRAYNDYAISYDPEDGQYWLPGNLDFVSPAVKVPTEITFTITNENSETIVNKTYSLEGSYIEYCLTQMGQGARLLQLVSKETVNTRVYSLPTQPSSTITKTRRTDFSFQEAIEMYFVDYDVRSYIEAYCETMGGFGKFSRDGLFEVTYLKDSSCLYPDDTLYPSNSLYPSVESANAVVKPSGYIKCYMDDRDSKLYSKVFCTYKNADNEEEYAEYVIVDTSNDDDGKSENDASNYIEYDISDNLLLKMNTYTEQQINTILQRVANRIKGIKYRPFDIEMLGHPEIEAGDLIRVITDDGSFMSYVLRRQLKGIKLLKDSINAD